MICPQCKEQGLKSNVYIGYTTTTAMCCQSYYDEEGKMHNHDMNTSTTQYGCSKGHKWCGTDKTSCWCGWGK